ncbi:nucleotidyltransferase family protein [Candidatus Acetothermia bacterium]|nr:nucleotidyltransferase family protein [Candidatus Acetothermia bacterium]MCI2432140.1 nucleotidyltransferase family protein [Candidatus Acetothermia bacterium]MCI2436167.1 nucleotidyltransferase family protein [Candidatus Acetothermia bacterium]
MTVKVLAAQRLTGLREQILEVLLPHGATKIALFGSVVRGEDSPESDIDILVKFREPIGLFALAHLREELSERLGRPVDLVTEGFLSRYIRPYVEKEKAIIYEEE